MLLRNIIFAAIIFGLSATSSSFASESNWISAYQDSAKVKVIGSFYEKNGEKKLIAGLHFKMAKGWKIYGPGSDSFGMPAQVSLNGSLNYKSHKIIWPAATNAQEKIGDEVIKYSYYKDEVVLPVEVDVTNAKEDSTLVLHLNYGVCKDICIPAEAKFELKIPQATQDKKSLVEIQKFYAEKITDETAAGPQENHENNMLFYIVIFAIIGGAILNIMPCVLPVLSLKLMSVVKHSEAPLRQIRFSFFATTLGILASFLTFAIFALILKATGNSFGWGLQFQNPYFLTFLVAILTLFAANLLGLFEFSSQSFLANLLNKKISENESNHHIFLPNFLSGILAVLLATPCSAPFLGSAISFALTGDTIDIIATFLAIGFGFALPYIILIFSPKLISLIPKPGHWMITLKKVLAFCLIATILWLIYVLSNVIGPLCSCIIGLLAILVFLSFKIKSHFWRSLAIGLLVIAIFVVPTDFTAKQEKHANDQIWQNFSEVELEKYVAQDRVVLVDITADWCLTCKFNKLRVLHDAEIMRLLKNGTIIGLRADITKHNEEIVEFMKSKNRFAIPFNAVYGPNAREGLLTSELLSKEELLTKIKQAQ